MKSNRRCLECGRRRKPSHEKRCGTEKAYTPECIIDEKFDMKAYKLKIAQKILDTIKEEAKTTESAKVVEVVEVAKVVEAEVKA